jgi:pyruvate,water dikinase
VALREDQRYYWQKSLALTRRLYLLAADILRAAGVIAERTDVFYATHGDLVAFAEKAASGAELSDRIVARRTEWSTFVQEFRQAPASSYPAFLGGSEPPAPTPTEPEAWQARAVSPGTARGAARVVRSVSDLARVQSGEILVAPSTDPAWTPVFGRIAGLVLERGGVLSHGAVVAREYGVPAVAGITNIAEQIRNGEMIEVDGNSGRVTRVA